MNIIDKTIKPTRIKRLTDKAITVVAVIGVSALLLATLSQINDGKDQLNQDRMDSHRMEIRK